MEQRKFMKPSVLSWLLIFGLALVGGNSRAAMRMDAQVAIPQQQQMTPPVQNGSARTTGFRQNQHFEPSQTPATVPPKPSGVLNVPSGVLHKPSSVLFVPPGTVSTLPGEARVPKQNFAGGQRDFRRTHVEGNHDGHFRDGHGAHHRHNSSIIVYVNGAPFWYPVYTAYPYYYGVPLSPTYDNGYSSTSTYVPSVEGDDSATSSSYAEAGLEWGQDLRREIVTWDQFVDYVRGYIVGAPPAAQADFREAFIESYGINGAAAYDKAAAQAVGPSTQGPKVINMPSGY
jgi:hypothetical protein